ncbi:MAG: hypothetical protein AABZ55_09440, partial [Bdellovibrionota bacterium]
MNRVGRRFYFEIGIALNFLGAVLSSVFFFSSSTFAGNGQQPVDAIIDAINVLEPEPNTTLNVPTESGANVFGPRFELITTERKPKPIYRDLFARIVPLSDDGNFHIPLTKYNIERMVGAPDKLRPETLKKIQTLPYRFKVNLMRLFSERAGQAYFSGAMNSPELLNSVSPITGQQDVIALSLDDRQMSQLKGVVKNSWMGNFRDDEIMDLGVFLLAKANIIPTGKADWDRVKGQIKAVDIYIASTVIGTMLLSNKAKLGVAGFLFKNQDDSLRVGYYANTTHLGFRLKPGLATGIKTETRYVDIRTGIEYNPHDAGRKKLIASIGDRFFSTLINTDSLIVTTSAQVAYNFNNTSPVLNHTTDFSATVVGVKVGEGKTTTIQVSGGSNMRGKAQANITGIIEDQSNNRFTSISMGTTQVNPVDSADTRVGAGVFGFVGGTFNGKNNYENAKD